MCGSSILSFGIQPLSDTIYFVEHKQINKQRRNAMDRSMKVMFGMMTVAICLLAITMMGNQSQQAYAGEYVGGGDRGTEPTIVSFRVIPITRTQIIPNGSQTAGGTTPTSWVLLTRMWSDGTVEMNLVGNETIPVGDMQGESFTGWITVTDSVAGYACVGDTDGNRSVDVTDLVAVIDNWGQCEEDPPVNIPPDPDLM
jgi:hypothetical protein